MRAAGAPLPPVPGGAPAARRHLLLVNNLREAAGGEGKHIVTAGAPTLPEMVRALDQADGWGPAGTRDDQGGRDELIGKVLNFMEETVLLRPGGRMVGSHGLR